MWDRYLENVNVATYQIEMNLLHIDHIRSRSHHEGPKHENRKKKNTEDVGGEIDRGLTSNM